MLLSPTSESLLCRNNQIMPIHTGVDSLLLVVTVTTRVEQHFVSLVLLHNNTERYSLGQPLLVRLYRAEKTHFRVEQVVADRERSNV